MIMWSQILLTYSLGIILSFSFDFKNEQTNIEEQVNLSINVENQENDIREFVNQFYEEIAKDSLYTRFLIPDLNFHKNYYLDQISYLDRLRSSGWFSQNYIKNDSILISSCVKEFNKKKYSIDLEGSFFDECKYCKVIKMNRITGLEGGLESFFVTIVMKSNNHYTVMGNCKGENGEIGSKIKLVINIAENDQKFIIDKIELL